MAKTDQIIEKAKEVGDLLAEHESARKLEQAINRLQNDQETQRAVTDYQRHLQQLSEKESSGQPIEPAEKQKLQQLQQQVVASPLLRDLQTAQMDYLDLLRRIDDTMTGQTNTPTPGSAREQGGQGGQGPGGGGGGIMGATGGVSGMV